MTPKLAGCCSLCDKEVFEIIQKDPLPRKVGKPYDDAVRVGFILANGSRMDLTFCKSCADGLQPHDFPFLWQRVMLTWIDESPEHPWAKSQADNAILAISHQQLWKDVA